MSRRRSESERFRQSKVTDKQATVSVGADEKSKQSGILKNEHHDKIQKDFKQKLHNIYNSSAPLNFPEQHYEQVVKAIPHPDHVKESE